MLKNNFLAKAFDWLGEAFEKFNPSAYRFLAAVLPYSTPFPVAWITARSAETFLNFTPTIAFIFVISLEGIGLWFTSLFVDAVVDWIRSHNWKTFAIVGVLGLAVGAYIYLLVSLNVTLELANGESNPIYSRIVTLLCFLPLITGIGNGYYKLKLKFDTVSDENKKYEQDKEERIRQEKREDRLKSKALSKGINIFEQPVQTYQSVVPQVSAPTKGDWRLLTPDERRLVVEVLTPHEIMIKHNVARATAFEWKKKKL